MKRVLRASWHLTARFGLMLLAMVYVAVPGWDLIRDDVADQADPPTRAIPDDVLDAARALPVPADGSGPLILCYHEVLDQPNSAYAITPERLAEQLGALRLAGYRTISVDQFVGYLNGAQLPPRSLLLTFDDSTKWDWINTDPILARNGFTAVSFVITGSVSTNRSGFHLSWDEMDLMRQSGRWEFESHTHDGHVRVPAGPDGRTGPWLANRIYQDRRLESVKDFRSRIATDLDRSIAALEAHGLPKPRLFAYPYSAKTAPTNDRSLFAVASAELHRRFAAAFTDYEDSGFTPPNELAGRDVRRLIIQRDLSTIQLLSQIAAGVGIGPDEVPRPLERLTDWSDPSGGPAKADIADGTLTLRRGDRTWAMATLLPGRSVGWTSYRVDVSVSGLAASPVTAGLRVLSGDDQQMQVRVSAGKVRVERGRGDASELAQAELPVADAYRITTIVGGGRVVVEVDGTPVIEVPLNDSQGVAPRGGIGLFQVGVSADVAPPVFRDLVVGSGSS